MIYSGNKHQRSKTGINRKEIQPCTCSISIRTKSLITCPTSTFPSDSSEVSAYGNRMLSLPHLQAPLCVLTAWLQLQITPQTNGFAGIQVRPGRAGGGCSSKARCRVPTETAPSSRPWQDKATATPAPHYIWGLLTGCGFREEAPQNPSKAKWESNRFQSSTSGSQLLRTFYKMKIKALENAPYSNEAINQMERRRDRKRHWLLSCTEQLHDYNYTSIVYLKSTLNQLS